VGSLDAGSMASTHARRADLPGPGRGAAGHVPAAVGALLHHAAVRAAAVLLHVLLRRRPPVRTGPAAPGAAAPAPPAAGACSAHTRCFGERSIGRMHCSSLGWRRPLAVRGGTLSLLLTIMSTWHGRTAATALRRSAYFRRASRALSVAGTRRRFFAADMAAGLYRASAYYLAHALAGAAPALLVGSAALHMRALVRAPPGTCGQAHCACARWCGPLPGSVRPQPRAHARRLGRATSRIPRSVHKKHGRCKTGTWKTLTRTCCWTKGTPLEQLCVSVCRGPFIYICQRCSVGKCLTVTYSACSAQLHSWGGHWRRTHAHAQLHVAMLRARGSQ
jgi:hypothetical protein